MDRGLSLPARILASICRALVGRAGVFAALRPQSTPVVCRTTARAGAVSRIFRKE
jgi:hypothetical protein